MEDGLGGKKELVLKNISVNVLILVVMEDGLGVAECVNKETGEGLNPCCNGRWSRRMYPLG